MSSKGDLRRKHSPVDLQQVVTELDVFKRPVNIPSGKSVKPFGVEHEACVATTENGKLFLIEKGVSLNDDINYPIRYREGECRIVQVTKKDIRDWTLVRSVEEVNPGVTLEDLFDSCGSDYGLFTDNCLNGTQRMRVAANASEDGLTWQEKVGIGVGVAAVGGLVAFALSGRNKKDGQKH